MTSRPAAYIFHGCCDEDEYFSGQFPSPSNSHWIPWLQKQLLTNGYACQTPEMPRPYAPDYDEWTAAIEALAIDANTVLVAHSCSGGFLIKWLSKSSIHVGKLVLVAPWKNPYAKRGAFLEGSLDPSLAGRVGEIHVFFSSDEPVRGVAETVELVLQAYPAAKLHRFEGMGHFCMQEMGTGEFPELLAAILGTH